MIEVSVQPSHLVAGTPVRLAIRFANTGQGSCSKIVFRLEVPDGITLLEGRSKVEIPAIPAGGSHTHEVTVEPATSGEFQLESSNFSYCNEFGVPVHGPGFGWRLSVQAAPPPRPVTAPPVPSPGIELERGGDKLTAGEWGEIKILVRNTSDVPLSDVAVAVSGPFEADSTRPRGASALPAGKAVRATFGISALRGGRLPVTVDTAFSYPDSRGGTLRRSQQDRVSVEVIRAGEPLRPSQVILYLSACPHDMVPLRTNDELREVTQELQLGQDRDQFRLEWCPAIRAFDISRALGRHRPQIVHFSGHGNSDGGLYLEDEKGLRDLVTPDGLADIFGGYSATVTCVIVNACHSMKLAEAMADRIDHVIGMRCEIGDQASIIFSVGFYQGLFAGLPVPEAFRQGCSLVRLKRETNPEFQTPVLLTRPG